MVTVRGGVGFVVAGSAAAAPPPPLAGLPPSLTWTLVPAGAGGSGSLGGGEVERGTGAGGAEKSRTPSSFRTVACSNSLAVLTSESSRRSRAPRSMSR